MMPTSGTPALLTIKTCRQQRYSGCPFACSYRAVLSILSAEIILVYWSLVGAVSVYLWEQERPGSVFVVEFIVAGSQIFVNWWRKTLI
jgi:hypothetical protein